MSNPTLPDNIQEMVDTDQAQKASEQSSFTNPSATSSMPGPPTVEPYRIHYNYASAPTLRQLALDNHRIRGVMGPFGSGKSSACIMEIVRRARLQPPSPDGIRRSRWAIIRNTFRQLSDTTIRTVHDWLPPSIFGEWNKTDHNYIITALPGIHLELMFRALDRPDHVSNLLSLEITGAWINEAREIPKVIFQAVDGRIGRYPSRREMDSDYWHGIIMDTNPPDEDSWWYKYFEKNRPDNAALFKQPSGLSPRAENIPYLPRGYYTNLAKGKDDMYVRVYVHGQYGYIREGRAVWECYNDNVHVASHILSPIKNLPIIIGMDFGLNPSAVLGQVTPRGKVLILDELISESGLKQFCKGSLIPLLANKYFGYQIKGYGDPSGTHRAPTDESTCYEVLWSREIGLRDILPADTNAILPRVGAVEDILNRMVDGEPCFVLSPNCNHLRKAMNGGYHYKRIPGADELYSDIPEKNIFSHIADALQYFSLYISDYKERQRKVKQFQERVNGRQEYRAASQLAGY